MVAREVITDTVLLGHWVPKGVTILINSGGPGFLSKSVRIDETKRSETARTKHWGGVWDEDDMHLFNPDRWLRKDPNGAVVYDSRLGRSCPSALSPRGCFGKRLAYLELRMVG